ncbi:hypothetical protein EVAR_47908_1 [Eumeta japonica]|uniref:Uncharacterized protein n=1 Tax=Eumeta variegata TaxID=151549 RepID=A0A4C1YAP2_EUMVA|nr:hypothetical protein EVAR_47908_1 [Eumeta japonica]
MAKTSNKAKDVRGTVPAGAPPTLLKSVEEVGPADTAVAKAGESDIGVFIASEAVGGFARRASLKRETCRRSLSASGSSKRRDLSGDAPRPEFRNASFARMEAHTIRRLASGIGNLALEA